MTNQIEIRVTLESGKTIVSGWASDHIAARHFIRDHNRRYPDRKYNAFENGQQIDVFDPGYDVSIPISQERIDLGARGLLLGDSDYAYWLAIRESRENGRD